MRRGADSGRTTVAGWRSNVTTALRQPSSAASRRTWAITAWWPRWTPSYAPIVTTVRSLDDGSSSALITCTLPNRSADDGRPSDPHCPIGPRRLYHRP